MEKAVIELLQQDHFAQLGTINTDGTPHVDTVWIGFENNQVIVATTMATKKAKNLSANPNAYMVITNHSNPYEQAQLKLKLLEIKSDQDMSLCDKIARLYTGKPFPQRKHAGRVALYFEIVHSHYHIARV